MQRCGRNKGGWDRGGPPDLMGLVSKARQRFGGRERPSRRRGGCYRAGQPRPRGCLPIHGRPEGISRCQGGHPAQALPRNHWGYSSQDQGYLYRRWPSTNGTAFPQTRPNREKRARKWETSELMAASMEGHGNERNLYY